MPQSRTAAKPASFARVIECNKLDTFAPIHWLALAFKDIANAPILSLLYGLVFSVIPVAILYFVYHSGTHLVILPQPLLLRL